MHDLAEKHKGNANTTSNKWEKCENDMYRWLKYKLVICNLIALPQIQAVTTVNALLGRNRAQTWNTEWQNQMSLPIFGINDELISGDDIDKSRQMGSRGQQRTPNAAFLRKQFSLESRHSSVSSWVDAIPRPG